MVPITGLLSQRALQKISTRSSELNHNFLLRTTPRHRDRSKITTSGWRRTFRCSVRIDRMIGQICFQWQSLPTIITTTHRLKRPPFLWTMDITWPLWMSQVPDSLTGLTSGSAESTRHRRNANVQLNSLKKFQNECTIDGKTRTLASRLEIWFGLRQPTSQLMNLHQSLWASDMAPLKSRTSSWIWPITLNCLCIGDSTMFSMLTFCWKQRPTQFRNISSQCHLLLRLTTRISGLWRSMLMLNGSEIVSNSRSDGMDFQKSMIPGRMQMASILVMGPRSWGRMMMILIWKKISITGTLMLQRELTLLLLRGSQPGDGGHTVSPWGHGPLVGGTAMILLFFLCFSLACSVLLLPLLSTPPLTHDPPIFLYFINHCCTSRFSALLCWQMWPHSIHETYLMYDAYLCGWNTFPPVCVPR